ncbi:MAG TPA: HAMP domain-containing sensor histidine kinase [Rubrobacter sp.]|nr:HAMP domain-containing sensor histidine kinase [Rubrobacter sp.]
MPVRWRLTIFNALAIGAILVALGLVLFFVLRATLLSSVEETAQSRAFAAARSIADGEGLEEEEGRLVLDDDLVDGITVDGAYIIVRDGRGNVIAQTLDLPAAREARDEVWRVALEAGRPAEGVLELSGEGTDYVYAVPVRPYGGPARTVEAGKSYALAAENVREVALVLAGGIGAAFLLSVVGAYLLARAALSPVAAIARAARKITGGDLSQRLPVARPKDEIGDLAATFNGMLSRLEGTLADLKKALARQRRFAADASHELRTPLTSIHSNAQLLEEWGLKDERIGPESVAAIRRESERMRRLIEGLLELTRGDEGATLRLEHQDLTVVADEATEAARTVANGRVTIEHPPSREPVDAVFDRERLRQAISILLDNAVKYTPEGGRISLEVSEEPDAVSVIVSDTGIGIPEDRLPHVFERFYRAEEARSTQGSGLGLAIARQIVEDHGGSLRARSRPGEGSTFTIRIPRHIPPDGTDT